MTDAQFNATCLTLIALASQFFLYRLGMYRIKRNTPEQYEQTQ